MSDINIVIRTVDQTREAEVALSGSQTGGDVIHAAVENWSLPEDTDYSLVNIRTAKPIQPDGSLDAQGVEDGDVLEVRSASDMAPPKKSSMRWTDKSQSTPRAPAVDRVTVTCPNCKADLRLAVGRSVLAICPFCNRKMDSAP